MSDAVHQACKGRWRCTKNEKFDEYLGKHGIGFVLRKLVNKVPCTVELVQNEDGTWTIKEITYVRTASDTYTIDERHPAVHPVTQNPVFATTMEEDGKILNKGFASEDSEEVVEWASREILEDGTMLQIIYFGDVVCKRWFVKEQ